MKKLLDRADDDAIIEIVSDYYIAETSAGWLKITVKPENLTINGLIKAQFRGTAELTYK